jgi:site-specific DNA-methyltransferase (adenine-specific)
MEINKLYNMDCREGLKKLEDLSIDCCISSPPYWSLRDYGIGEDALGLEDNFYEFITNLCDVYDLVKRVLKKSGTCWVNLGDTYSSTSVKSNWDSFAEYRTDGGAGKRDIGNIEKKRNMGGIPSKCLLMIPQRFAIEMVNRGWILRNVIIWHKPNCMPSSARDRFTVDFEYVYFFVKHKKYWFEQQREPHKQSTYDRMKYGYNPSKKSEIKGDFMHSGHALKKGGMRDYIMKEGWDKYISPQGKNKRTVWTIPTHANPEAHFATFPPKLVQPMIKAGCPEYVCSKCGRPRERIIEPKYEFEKDKYGNKKPNIMGTIKPGWADQSRYAAFSGHKFRAKRFDKTIGYTDCGCNKLHRV